MNENYKEHLFKDDKGNNLETYSDNSRLMENALKCALDTRKFEIDLYWKRTTYFSIIIGAIFASYIKLYSSGDTNKVILLILILLGLAVSFGWYLSTKGSKFWQENWEKHVGFLEDNYQGRLYKSILCKEQEFCKEGLKGNLSNIFNPMSPYPYSVSKINSIISFLVTLTWIFILFDMMVFSFPIETVSSFVKQFVAGVLICFCCVSLFHMFSSTELFPLLRKSSGYKCKNIKGTDIKIIHKE